jgi:membrane protein DedA with SNARE-associated domain
VLGLGAAIENIFPPAPADTFVLLGAFLASTGRASNLIVFFSTWIANVVSALIVYGVARRYGEGAFRTRIGHWVLKPRQLDRISQFYGRRGTPAIFMSRFLPAFRAIVPVFAGVSGISFPRVAIPLAVASAIWYGALIVLANFAGNNWSRIVHLFDRVSTVLLVIALVLIAGFGWWWWRTRHETD